MRATFGRSMATPSGIQLGSVMGWPYLVDYSGSVGGAPLPSRRRYSYTNATRGQTARCYAPQPVTAIWTRVAAIVLLLGALGSFAPAAAAQSSSLSATVTYVVDGDTVDVQLESGNTERIRLIGIDTPETVDPRKPVQCFGREASDHAH